METTIRGTGRRAMPVGLLMYAAIAQGCAAPVAGDGEEVTVQMHGLYAETAVFWDPVRPFERYDIPVCWEDLNAPASFRSSRQRAVEGAWSRYARINFLEWDSCKRGDYGIHVRACSAKDPSIGCESFEGSHAWPFGKRINGVSVDANGGGIELATTGTFGIAIHEFGHALGFFHDFERYDYAGAGCEKKTIPKSKTAVFYGMSEPNSVMGYECDGGAAGLTPNDIAGVQKAYGRRIPGTLISTSANCASSDYYGAANAPAYLWDCDEIRDDQEWKMTGGVLNGYYLQLTDGGAPSCLAADAATAGQGLKLKPCGTGKDWLFDRVALRGPGGMCLTLPGGNTTNGTQLQTWACTNDVSQQFSITSSSNSIRFGGRTSNKCLRSTGGKLVVWDCGASGETFSFDSTGRMIVGGACADVANVNNYQFTHGEGLFSNGDRVQVTTCRSETLNQMWNVSGALKYAANPSLCMTRSLIENNGGGLSLEACSGTIAQVWDYYFRP